MDAKYQSYSRQHKRISSHLSRESMGPCIRKSSESKGFALPLVIVVGLFLMVGGFAMLGRTLGSFRGSIRSSQQTQAQENAERGVAEILRQLNQPEFRYLWVNCHRANQNEDYAAGSSCGQASIVGGWNNRAGKHGGKKPIFNGTLCAAANPDTYTDNLKLKGDVNATSDSAKANRGSWLLEKYTYFGNPFTGGRGVIQVRGTRTNKQGDVMAETVIEHSVQVEAKPCSQTLTEDFDGSAFPGLLAKDINLGQSDVVGGGSANVYCTECSSTSDLYKNNSGPEDQNNSVVDGNIYTGEITLPPVPTFPTQLRSAVEPGILHTKQGKISIKPPSDGAGNKSFHPQRSDSQGNTSDVFNPDIKINPRKKPMCVLDHNNEAHCLVEEIDLAGNNSLEVNTNAGSTPVRIYLSGNLSYKGQSELINIGGSSTDLAIFSTKTSCSNNNFSQELSVRGGSSLQTFIYAPCATVDIKGGSNSASCEDKDGVASDFDNKTKTNEDTKNRLCTSGDIWGAVWAGKYTTNSQVAEITVPKDMNNQVVSAFGEDFSIGASDFVGVDLRSHSDWRWIELWLYG